MAARKVNIREAKTHLSRLVDEAAAGQEIVTRRPPLTSPAHSTSDA